MTSYAYRGNARFHDAVSARIEAAGFSLVDDLEQASFVMTFCTTMSELEDLYFGDDGLVQMVQRGTILLDLSATTPNFAHEMNAITTINELKMVEAPLVVRRMADVDAFAKEGMYCYAAGEDDSLEKARPLLDALFSEVKVVNSAGAAQLARCAETLRRIGEFTSAIETFALFAASKRTVTSFELEGLLPDSADPETQSLIDAAKERSFEGSFTVEMLMSELSAVMMASDDFEVIMPQAESAFHMFELLALIGGGEMNPAALILLYGTEEDAEEYGLDWSRAEGMYPEEETETHYLDRSYYDDDDEDDRPFDDPRFEDPYDERAFEEFGNAFDYSSN